MNEVVEAELENQKRLIQAINAKMDALLIEQPNMSPEDARAQFLHLTRELEKAGKRYCEISSLVDAPMGEA